MQFGIEDLVVLFHLEKKVSLVVVAPKVLCRAFSAIFTTS